MQRFTVFFAILTCAYAVEVAVVYLFDPSGTSNVKGSVTFKKTDGGILVTGTVTGLAEGKHGFHVHNLGDISSGCGASGLHFNPHNVTHGGPDDTTRHVGDLGNIIATTTGVASINITDSVIALDGAHNILGRTLVVHEGTDDLGKGGNDDSLSTGNAGGRLACGVIGIGVDSVDSAASQLSNPVTMIASVLVFILTAMFY